MTQIILDSDWMVEVDNYGNHIPHRFKEVRKRVKGGGVRETVATGEFAWHNESKFFANVEQAIRLHIIPTMQNEQLDVCSMHEYCEQAKELVDYFVERLGK